MRTILSIVCILLACTSNVDATTIMFTDRTAWESNFSGVGFSKTTIDFEQSETFTSGGPDWNTAVWYVTAEDVIFSSLSAPLEVTTAGFDYGTGHVLYPAFNQTINVELPSSVYAFGFDLGELGSFVNVEPPTLNNVVLSNGDVFGGPYYGISYIVGDPSPTYAFFGFISDMPISICSMHPHAFLEPIIDNFSYVQSIPTPEPSSLLLVCSGLLALLGGWRNSSSKKHEEPQSER